MTRRGKNDDGNANLSMLPEILLMAREPVPADRDGDVSSHPARRRIVSVITGPARSAETR
jgi:hypothetical protein